MLSADCMGCLMQREVEATREIADEQARAAYIREVARCLAQAGPDTTAPALLSDLRALYRAAFQVEDRFEGCKRRFNALLLDQQETLRARLRQAADPLAAALLMARAGNYIDFGALGDVEPQQLTALLEGALSEGLPQEELERLRWELGRARRLVYLTDNCGEIVLDKLCLEVLQKLYPDLELTVLVRGAPVLNDATMEDARQVGLTPAFTVLPNGADIAGTDLARICPEARKAVMAADVILSKGQGNFETLQGSGLNIYYLFLCKCDWFVRRFHLPKLQGAFVNERRFDVSPA